MTKHIVLRILAGLVLLAAIAGIGFFAYQAGLAHATTVDLTTVPSDRLPYPVYGWHFMPFYGLGCLAPLAVLFLVFLAFGMLRRMIWGPRWGWRHMGQNGHRHGPWGEGVPPMFSEWHRRAHEGKPEESAPADKKE
jgi:hypothetical protein